MQIYNGASLFAFLVSLISFVSSAQAAEYDSLSKCRAAYYSTQPSGSITAADAFCKPKMDPIVFCTDQAVLLDQQTTGNSYTAPQIANLNQRYRSQCVATGSASVAGATPAVAAAPAGMPSQQNITNAYNASVAACGSDANCKQNAYVQYQAQLKQFSDQQAANAAAAATPGAAVPGASNSAANTQAALQIAQLGANAAQGNQGQGGQQAQQQSAPAAVAAPTLGGQTPAAAPAAAPQVVIINNGAATSTSDALAQAKAATAPAVPVAPAVDPAKLEASNNAALAQAEKDFGPAAKDAKGIDPSIDKKIDDSSAATKGDPTPAPSEITQASTKATSDMKTELTGMGEKIATQFNIPGVAGAYAKSAQAYGPAATEALAADYETAKKLCAADSEKTEMLCVEGSSPGAKAARVLMDAAGPVLAIISSAQKACSSTAKISKVANIGLTIANGVCIASKIKCESVCEKALATLAKSQETFEAHAATALTGDETTALNVCKAYAKNTATAAKVQPCLDEMKTKRTFAGEAKGAVAKVVVKQKSPTPGTASGLMAKCADKSRNIMSTIANIASLALAQQGAEDCEKKLATSGAAGNALTSQQYCETPANTGSQFCKCQLNNTQEGCPGYLVATPPGTEPGKDIAGTNIKANSGLSNFAGGSASGGAKPGDYNLNGAALGAGGDANPFTAGPGGAAAGGTVGGGGSGDSPAGGGVQPSEAGGPKVEKEDKKWSFGSFGSSVGSLFGGGSASKSGNGNGEMSPTQEAAIQRRIASEKYSAEVSSASGPTNWDKVHKTVIRVENTFMNGK